MKIKVALITASLVVSILHTSIAGDQPINPHIDAISVYEDVPPACIAKVVTVEGTFAIRETQTLEVALDAIHLSYTVDNPAEITHATYVDLLRITRDVYRTKNDGNWRRQYDKQHIAQMIKSELEACMFDGY